jgi:FlaA1/EpsC-like NDP-sugar epimerase
MGYPVLPIGSVRASGWIVTIIFPAWLIALRHFNLYNPVSYRRSPNIVAATIKANILASVLMLNVVFILRGFSGVSRPLLALIIAFSFFGLITEKLAAVLLMRYRWRLQRRSSVWRVLLVGSHSDAENYLKLVREHPEWNLEIVDVVAAAANGMAMRGAGGNLHSTIQR